MSRYTTEVRFICENKAGLNESTGYVSINETISKAIPNIFTFDFPIFDEAYRTVLETKILKHYYTREIGVETVGLWLFRLETKLNEIMPYYNQLYKSATLNFNPFYDTDYSRTGNNAGSGSNTGTQNANAHSVNKYSDTPQGSIQNIDLENNAYLTNARITDDTGKTDSKSNYTSLDEYTEHVVGKRSTTSYAKLLMEYRKSMLNIDMMIIDELSDLFMLIY